MNREEFAPHCIFDNETLLKFFSEPNTRLFFNKKCVFTHVYIYCRNAHTAPRATHILLYTGCICICNQSQCKCGKGKNPLSSLELVAFSISRITWRLSWSLIQLRSVVLPFLEIVPCKEDYSNVVTLKVSIPNVWVKRKKRIVLGLTCKSFLISFCSTVPK